MGNIIGLKLITNNTKLKELKKIKKIINKYIDYNNQKRFSSIDKINNKRYIYINKNILIITDLYELSFNLNHKYYYLNKQIKNKPDKIIIIDIYTNNYVIIEIFKTNTKTLIKKINNILCIIEKQNNSNSNLKLFKLNKNNYLFEIVKINYIEYIHKYYLYNIKKIFIKKIVHNYMFNKNMNNYSYSLLIYNYKNIYIFILN